jgi:hypothetical protein
MGSLQAHTIFQERRCDHEDDEKHKRQIEQRRDVDLRKGRETLPLGIAAHGKVKSLQELNGYNGAGHYPMQRCNFFNNFNLIF